MKTIPIYDAIQGKAVDNINISDVIEQKEKSPATFACALRVLRQNWRQGTVACKTRGEVSFSNKKPWKQKGTGRARVSSLRSPLWRKGGIIFGPQARVRRLDMNVKQRRVVLNNLFFSMLKNDAIRCLDVAQMQKPSTKMARNVLNINALQDKKVVIFLPFHDEVSAATFRNMPNINILLFDEPNAYDLSNSDYWVFLKKDVELFKEMIARWN
jgi:large subunit ribosomal protein L4